MYYTENKNEIKKIVMVLTKIVLVFNRKCPTSNWNLPATSLAVLPAPHGYFYAHSQWLLRPISPGLRELKQDGKLPLEEISIDYFVSLNVKQISKYKIRFTI